MFRCGFNGSIDLCFGIELAKKPLQCLEYIIVHEMVHLLERKHVERFLAYMNKFLPNWKAYKEDLRNLPIAFYITKE